MHFLRKCNMFSRISPSKLRYIATHVTFEQFDKKEFVYKYNDEAYVFYVIKNGSVEIIHNVKLLQVLGKFDIFGDRCKDEPIRSNSAKVLVNCTCLVIKYNDFKDVMDDASLQILEKKKTFLAAFNLNQLLLVKQISQTTHDYIFLAYVEHINVFFKVEVLTKYYFDEVKKFEKIIETKNIAMQSDHQFLQNLVKTFSDAKHVYLVYEHIDSIPLTSLLGRTFNQECAKFLAGCLLLVIEYFHEKGIIYRGLDPENIIINENGYPIL